MSDFLFKTKEKEIRHASDDPNRATKEAKAKHIVETGGLKFDSEGHRKDYERAVSSNSRNIYGLPEFFPPEVLKATGFGEGKDTDFLPCGHKWSRIVYNEGKDRTVTKVLKCKHGHAYTHNVNGYEEITNL